MGGPENTSAFFVSDLHGKEDRFEKLFKAVEKEKPGTVFMGGDITPAFHTLRSGSKGFLEGYFFPKLNRLREKAGESYPQIFAILGNDDGKSEEPSMIEAAKRGLLTYLHGRRADLFSRIVFGYSYVPPTPFALKDWERYDVSRYVDPGCVSPEEGAHSVEVGSHDLKYGSIRSDLEKLTAGLQLENSIFLFHAPPYDTVLDRAALDGMKIDHVPLDVHAGSIAIKRFIEEKQPVMTMHGHIHESAGITGSWKCLIGKTLAVTAAHDGPELALVRFDLKDVQKATRELL